MKLSGYFLLFLVSALNAGCTINSTYLLPAGGPASANRAVIVYGVKVEGEWPHAGFTLQLDEYDIARQNITGNCFRFNRTEARVPPTPGPIHYFAFDVPPGYYVYSPFHATRLAGDVLAFEAPAGRTVYIGDFVLEKGPSAPLARKHLEQSQSVSLTRNLDAARSDIDKALPKSKGDIALAEATVVKKPFPFLCAP